MDFFLFIDKEISIEEKSECNGVVINKLLKCKISNNGQ